MSARTHPRPQPTLSARADTKTVQEILSALVEGRLRTPPFQRGTRWREDDRVKLFDSVLRGIPIGTLLFSEPFRGQTTTEPGMLVLDGQQRTDTLRALVTPTEPGARALHLDTRNRTFRYARTEALDDSSTLVPVALLGEPEALLDALMEPPVPRETLSAALDVSRRLREYRVPVYELHDATEDEARLVFDRINATGRRLRQAEVFNALHARDGDAPVPSTSQLVAALDRLGFGRLADDEITKAVAILTGHDPGRDVREIRLDDAAATMDRVRAALGQAITFLQCDLYERLCFGTRDQHLRIHEKAPPEKRGESKRVLQRLARTPALHERTVFFCGFFVENLCAVEQKFRSVFFQKLTQEPKRIGFRNRTLRFSQKLRERRPRSLRGYRWHSGAARPVVGR